MNKETVKRILKKTLFYKGCIAVIKVRKIVNSPTYFSEYRRKSKLRRYYDNVIWLLEYRRHNPSYNLYGLDVKNFRNQNDYVDIKYIRKNRLAPHHEDEAVVKHRKENITIRYSLLADDKYVFYTYMNGILPGITPKLHFVFQGNKVISPIDKSEEVTTAQAFMGLKDGKYVSKAVIGAFGDSITVIEKSNDKIIFDNGTLDNDSYFEKTSGEPYLVQDFIYQHRAMSILNPTSVNTIRIISTRWNQKTCILAAMVRIGVDEQLVDNASSGGTFVGINVAEGTLMKYGYYYNKKREENHPVSGITYEGFRIPFWKESIALIKKIHPIIFGLSTIGWDIAITDEGPVIIEINWNYSIKGIQIACGGLKPKWEELKSK